jgi:RHS repeat-associated protein
MRLSAQFVRWSRRSRKAAYAGGVFAACLGVAPLAHAQVQTATPPVFSAIDRLGVDASTGQFHLATSEVVIGQPGAGGIAFGRKWIGSGWRDTLAGTISVSGSVYTVSLGASAETFTLSSGTYTSNQAMGSTLTYASSKYTYTLRDGTIVEFDTAAASCASVTSFWACNAGLITKMTRPDGEIITWTYSTASAGGQSAIRPQSISNNLNYHVHFTYAINGPNNGSEVTGGYLERTKVTGINRAAYNCSNTAFTCSDNTGANWPYVTYGAESGGIQTVTDRLSQTTRFEITSGYLTEVRLPTSSSVARTWIGYSSGKVANVYTNVGGWFNTDYTYSDASGVRTTTATPYFEGNVSITKTNITNGWVMELWADGAGTRKTVITRDGYGRVTRTTRADGDYTDVTYDGRGNVTQIVEAPKTGSGLSNITTTASYPGSCSNAKTCNKPDSTTDARGYRTDYTYSSTHGAVLTVTLPAPSGSAPVGSGARPETRFTYADASTGIYRLDTTKSCASGSSCANASNETVQAFTYDSQRRVATSTIRAGDSSITSTSSVTYTSLGDVATIDGPLSGTGDTSYLYYDDVRRLRASVSPDPDSGGSLQHRVSRTTYNADGFPTVVEMGHVSSPSSWASMTVLQRVDNTYELDKPVPFSKTALSSGGTTYAVQQFSVRDDLYARCTATRMNPSEFASLPTGWYAACQADTAGSYGPDRFAITGYSGYGQGTSVADGTVDGYGSPGRIVQAVLHDASSGVAEYLIDAGGNETKYEYDGFSRLLKTIFPSTTTPGSQNTSDYEELTYDAYGRMNGSRARDGNWTWYHYDNLGRLTNVDAPGTQYDVANAYDNFGRLTQTCYWNGSACSNTLSYAYDALSRMTSETQSSRTVSYQYDAAGYRTRLTWPDSFYVTYEYNAVGEVTAIRENGGTALSSFAYDNLGRRTALTRANGSVTGYTFDGASRLIDLALDLGGSTHDLWTDLGYNPASQIISKTINNTGYSFTLPSAYTDTYADNGLNQYTSAGGVTPTYDTRGNTTYDGTKSYTYDPSNRLITAGSSTLVYDPADRLYEIAGGSTVRFLYDGADMIAEYNTSGNVLRRYVHGPGMDEPLVWFEGAGHSGSGSPDRRYLMADERGSIIAVEGGSTAKNTYDEYGVPGSANTGRFQYTGQMWIAEAGLYHYKARAYSPELGRFLQADPIGYGDGMNMYNYVSGDPMNLRDPTGLEGQLCTTGTHIPTSNACKGLLPFWGPAGMPQGGGGGGGGSGGSRGGGGGSAQSCSSGSTGDCVVVTGRQVTSGGPGGTTFANLPYGTYYPNSDMGGRFYSEQAARMALIFAMEDLARTHYPTQVANNQMVPELSAKVRKYHNGKYGWSKFRIGCMNCNGVAGQVQIGIDDLTVSVVHMHWNGTMAPSFDPATNTGDVPEMFLARQQLFALQFLAGVGPGPNICAYVGGYGGQISPCY